MAAVGAVWLAATGVSALVGLVEPAVALQLLTLGMVVLLGMKVHRQQRILLQELRRRDPQPVRLPTDEASGRFATETYEGVCEILDRTKLNSLTMGRLSEELAAVKAMIEESARDEAEAPARELTS